ncbi:MAG: hypothetical protein GF317_24430 [Candidatus Lokiarchaeota archaeon]|nr:hypothetical protein [Candidatus Lokiarchaeota archaeon]MBD3202521.1 hypothetical protein [Candidatus Lokiarchaeota archaeon]
MYMKIEKKFEIEQETLNNPVVLIGWPGIGLVGKLAVSAIKDSIDAELFMDIQYYDFPPKSNVKDGSLDIPTAQVYYKPRESRDLFILTGDYQPQSPEGVFEFSQKFCEEMDSITNGNISMYISTGAMVSEKKIDETPEIYICGTDSKVVDAFLKYKTTKIMETGIIAGANGILPASAGKNGYAPGICLLAETIPIGMINLDPKASKSLVSLLKDFLNIDMDYSELDKQIAEMEEMFDKFKEQANHLMKGYKQDKGVDSYFR